MAATTIDDLQIKIEADAKTASDKLDALAQSMVKLASSLSINVGKMSGVAIGLNSITRASQNLNSRNITTLATAMGKVAGVDSAQISRVAGSMTQLKNSVSGGFNTDMTGIVNVANSLSKLGGIKATQGAQNLVLIKDQLAQFVQGMNSVGTFTFDPTGLTNTIKAIAKLGGKTATQATANLPSISAQLQNFVRQMNQIGSMSFDNKNLTDLVTSIGRLGSVASVRAVNNIPLLANNLKYLFETLSKAPYISQNIIQMTTALANLARTGASSGTAARSLGTSLFSFSKSAGNARNSAFSLAGAIGKFYATYWMVIRGLGLFRNAIDISSDLTEVENVVRTTFGNMEYKVNDFVQNSIQQFGMSELSVKQYASTFQAMGTAMDVGGKQIENANRFLNGATEGYIGLSDSMSDVSLNLTKLTADMASFYDKDQADVAKDLQSVFTGMVVPLRKYGLDLTQATLKEWAMKNGMDADIKSMTQAEKAMLRYQYVLANTTAAQGDFARTADTWANQVRILKQNFQQLGGIIGGALINAFKPFLRTLNFVMQKVISFATTVTNALGAIFGWKFEVSGGGVADDWSDAASSADDLADSTGKAADNTKKMKTNLLAIDELNVLNPDDSDSGSGGSGSGAGGAGGGAGSGGLVKTDTIWKDFESNIKSLYQLGSVIGDTLSKAMESIDWDSVYKKAENFGTGLAQFLNGLISPRLFYNLGKTIAGAINTAFHAENAFAIEFDWRNLGRSLASGITGFFENWDAELTAETFSNFAIGVLQAMVGALDKLSEDGTFATIGQKIVDFICGIKWADLSWNLYDFFFTLKDKLIEFPANFAEGIGQSIFDHIFGDGEIDFEIPAPLKFLQENSFNNFAPVEVVNNLQNVVEFVKQLSELVPIVLDKATQAAEEIKGKVSELKENIETFVSETSAKAQEILIGLPDWFNENVVIPVVNNFTTMKNNVTNLFRLLWTAVQNIWIVVSSWFNNNVIVPTVTFFTKFYEKVKKLFSDLWSNVQKIWKVVSGWFSDNVITPVSNSFSEACKNIASYFENLWKNVKNGVVGSMNGVISTVEKAVNKIIDLINSLKWKVPDWVPVIGGTSWGFNIKPIQLPSIPMYEVGGFPEDGLFFANHNEMVGQFSNGRTAVANNEQIVAGIREGVKAAVTEALAPYLSDIADTNREIAEKDASINVDGRELVNAINNRISRNGFSFT
jgi:hypothetical protein|nr:MAG TPA: minor tail protein [Bacteriophage sp.]